MSDTAYTGAYYVAVLSYGIDGVYGNTDRSNIIEAVNQQFNNPDLGSMSQENILFFKIADGIIYSPMSDDIAWMQRLTVKAPKSYAVRLDSIEDVVIGELLTVTGTSDKKEGSEIIITVKGPFRPFRKQPMPERVYVENGKFRATSNTDYARSGEYTVVADDGEGNTDKATVNLIPVPTPSPMVTVTPTPTETLITPEPTEPSQTPTPLPTETTPTPPGFEVIFAIAGLLAVAYLLRRRR